ncbi:VWA domain-containing protein [Novosphingobium sp. YJ-S2-02]|uniref:VWA domain-containing protein n=1 Tax=Novosphingobium aureum TaxID=2792964 RepID=A0A931HD63_9SPHN|nr:phage tail protein [Novosphingobium aureum]MBH0113256.1 VWA domain-containing protein [Novosphingobium aureum]
MGKGGSAKQEVNEYNMSMHLGVCWRADAITHITVGDKVAWRGNVQSNTQISISQPNLFGGPKKEGGVRGYVTALLGGVDQVLPDALAARLGRGTGANCPGFRGALTLFFTGTPPAGGSGGVQTSLGSIFGTRSVQRPGFYWVANTPYLKNIEVGVRRAPVGLNPDIALVYGGSRTPRAICFAIDLSGSMDGERLATLKSAMSTVLAAIGATADTGVIIDLAVVSFGRASSSIIRRGANGLDVAEVDSWVQSRNATASNTDFREGMNSAKVFFDATDQVIEERYLFFITDGEPTGYGTAVTDPGTIAQEAATALAEMAGVQSFGINIELADTTYTALIDNTPSDGVPIVEGSTPDGLVNAVNKALFGDNVTADANPAHIIYECCTNQEWGMGSPETLLDKASFEAAAITLNAEGLGLSLRWTQQDTIENFVSEIIDHVQATLFVNPRTGLLTLKLIRGDYDPDTLREINPDNADMLDFQRKGWGEITNEIVVTWTNPETEQDETVVVQDNGAIAAQGGRIISASRNYYAVRRADLATRLGLRDLRVASAPLASCEVELDRSAWDLLPGDVVRMAWPERGLAGTVMRVGPVDYGNLSSPSIRVSLVEDIFGFTIAEYEAPPGSAWDGDDEEPEPADDARIITLPAFLAGVARTDAGLSTDVDYPEVMAGVLASSDVGYNFDLWGATVQPDGSTFDEVQATCSFAGQAVLALDLASEARSLGVSLVGTPTNVLAAAGTVMLIGNNDDDETIMEVVFIAEEDGGTLTLERGLLDTVPRAWAQGTKVWLLDIDSDISDLDLLSDGETVSYKLLTRTFAGVLAPAVAPVLSGTLTARPHLPLRPVNATVAGIGFGEVDCVGLSTIPCAWATRNRLTEDARILTWTEDSIDPEDGQTTTLTLLDPAGNIIDTVTGIEGVSYDIPVGLFAGLGRARIRFSAERDGFSSLQAHEIGVLLENGYGYSYGNNYGGA